MIGDRTASVPALVNRRRHDRASVNGGVLVRAESAIVRCEVVDLSLGGVLVRELLGTDRGPRLAPDQEVSVELEVDRLGWVQHRGHVARVDEPSGATRVRLVAIAFAPLPAPLAEAIAGELRAADEARRSPRVLVVDPSPPRRRRVAAALRDAGSCPLEAATPLEAVDVMERSRVAVSAVAVAARTRSQTQTDELVEYLSEAHPGVRLALIIDSTGEAAPNPRPLPQLPADEHTDLLEPVRELLASLS
jgi:CheY-like chemotaxis protein